MDMITIHPQDACLNMELFCRERLLSDGHALTCMKCIHDLTTTLSGLKIKYPYGKNYLRNNWELNGHYLPTPVHGASRFKAHYWRDTYFSSGEILDHQSPLLLIKSFF